MDSLLSKKSKNITVENGGLNKKLNLPNVKIALITAYVKESTHITLKKGVKVNLSHCQDPLIPNPGLIIISTRNKGGKITGYL